MKTISAGPSGSFGIGFVREVSEEDGKLLIDGGYAKLVEAEEKKVEPVVEPKKTVKKDKVKIDG